MSFPVEFVRLQDDLKRSLFSRVFFRRFIDNLNKEQQANSSGIQSFRQANTFLFRSFVWISNLFLKKESQIVFFTSPRVQAWQFINNAGLLDNEYAQVNFDTVSAPFRAIIWRSRTRKF